MKRTSRIDFKAVLFASLLGLVVGSGSAVLWFLVK